MSHESDFNASLYAGIGCFLKQVGKAAFDTPKYFDYFKNNIASKLSPSGGNLDVYSKAMTSYGGFNGFIQNYYEGGDPSN